jgi:hypothetical protein
MSVSGGSLGSNDEPEGGARTLLDAMAMAQLNVADGPSTPRKRETVPPSKGGVTGLIPLDVVPVLAVAHAEVPWHELSELATQLVTRMDGRTDAMSLVTGTAATPNACIRELAALADRGLVRWSRS